MLSKTRSFFVNLHEDESGPTTVEWILLIIVAVLILIGIMAFANYMKGKATVMEDEIDQQEAVTTTAADGAATP